MDKQRINLNGVATSSIHLYDRHLCVIQQNVIHLTSARQATLNICPQTSSLSIDTLTCYIHIRQQNRRYED
jgi:hypothetical protein